MLLCDHCQVAEGKLYIAGGGWSVTGPGPVQMSVALLINVPWDQANTQISFQLALLQEDGLPVIQPGPVGQTPVLVAGVFEIGRPPGLKPGTPLDVPLAMNLGGQMMLAPDKRYSWELSINGETRDDWHLAFSTRPSPG